jgi:hypothetical protein
VDGHAPLPPPSPPPTQHNTRTRTRAHTLGFLSLSPSHHVPVIIFSLLLFPCSCCRYRCCCSWSAHAFSRTAARHLRSNTRTHFHCDHHSSLTHIRTYPVTHTPICTHTRTNLHTSRSRLAPLSNFRLFLFSFISSSLLPKHRHFLSLSLPRRSIPFHRHRHVPVETDQLFPCDGPTLSPTTTQRIRSRSTTIRRGIILGSYGGPRSLSGRLPSNIVVILPNIHLSGELFI